MKKRIPKFRSAEQEGEFWERHSTADYQLCSVTAEEVLAELKARHQSKKNVTFRLEPTLIQRLKHRAKQMGVKYQTFVRQWLWHAVM